jgi:hypothetical protein
MKTPLIPALLLALTGASLASGAETADLKDGFVTPPAANRPYVWWQWMDGNISKAGITADLEAMKKVGIDGATIGSLDGFGVPPGPVKYNSEEWRGLVKFAAEESVRLGLQLGSQNTPGWSSSGGPWVTPEHSMLEAVTSEVAVKGSEGFKGKLPQPPTKLNFYRDIAVLAFPTPANKPVIANLLAKTGRDRANGFPIPAPAPVPPNSVVVPGQVVDLTAETKPDGALDWTPPHDGNWTIVRIGYTSMGEVAGPAQEEARGSEVDKLSREALKAHWDGMLGKLQADLGPLMGQGKGMTGVLIDSYEHPGQNWTPKFKEDFQRLRGYDLSPYLPVFAGYTVESTEKTERFLWDMRRTVADLFTENYYGYFSELAHQGGLKSMIEPYGGGPFDELQMARNADEIMSEFWVCWPSDSDTAKVASSSAHIYGKKIVGAEALTSPPAIAGVYDKGRWTGTPFTFLPYIHQAFAGGVNHLSFHRFTHQRWTDRFPGMTMGPFGSFIDRTNTWWDKSADWMTYLGRCGYLLQQGNPVADVLWFVGENDFSNPPGGGLPDGYTFDGCTIDALLTRVKGVDGRLVLPEGTSYRLLYLPDSATLTPAMAKKLQELAEAGVPIAGGAKPSRSPSLEGYPGCDAEVKKIADALWDHGKVQGGKSAAQLLAALKIAPDFEVKNKLARLVYLHRAAGDQDLYFVANQKEYWQDADCVFRVSGKVPELWHADTGEIEPAPAWREEDGRTHVSLRFAPFGSVFVVFREKAAGERHAVGVTAPASAEAAPKLVIQKAVYGGRAVVNGVGKTVEVDVTAKLAALVQNGTSLSVFVTAGSFGTSGDWNRRDLLDLDYTLGGTPGHKTVLETDWLDLEDPARAEWAPDYRLHQTAKGELTLETWKPGSYQVEMSEGGPVEIASDAPAPVEVAGGWDLRFPPNWGAPEQAHFDKLISWSDSSDNGIKYFSGTATYSKTLDIPANLLGAGKRLYLDLGVVKEIAQVKLNGKDLGVIWKKPMRVEITGAAKAGPNQLEVEVTNLWPNRLIGDEQLPPDMEMARSGWIDDRDKVGDHPVKWPQWLLDGKPSPTGRFTVSSWRFWNKESPLLPSGLIGPVTLRGSVEQPVR